MAWLPLSLIISLLQSNSVPAPVLERITAAILLSCGSHFQGPAILNPHLHLDGPTSYILSPSVCAAPEPSSKIPRVYDLSLSWLASGDNIHNRQTIQRITKATDLQKKQLKIFRNISLS